MQIECTKVCTWKRNASLAAKALVLLGAAALLLTGREAVAQSILGTIRGAVFDGGGRPVPGAAVRVVDESTLIARSTEADADGTYEFPNLRAGSYRVEDDSPGFTAFRRTGVALRAGETARVDLGLAVAVQEVVVTGANETVPVPETSPITITVEGAAAIRLDSSAIQGGADSQQLQTLPRNSRELQDFLALNPNVVGPIEDPRFLGGRNYGVSYLQDGQPSTGTLQGRMTVAAPGLDAIDEVQVLSNAYSAEFGGLAAVVVTSRRGANRYSGAAYWDLNTDELNALTFAEKQAGLPRGYPGSDTRLQRFGASLGGPIQTGRTFFFADYEGALWNGVGGGRVATVPTEAMRRGDFSGASFEVVDPLTGRPFPGNVIPRDRIDPSAVRVLDFYYPLPNQDPLSNGLGSYQEFANVEEVRNRADLRIDHELSPNDSAFVRVSWQARDPGYIFEDSRFPQLGTVDRRVRTWTTAASWVRILSRDTSNELRVGFNVQKVFRRSMFVAGEVADQLGIEIPSAAREWRGYPSFSFSGPNSIRGISDSSEGANRDIRQSALSLSDSVTLLRGRHSLRVGALYSHDTVLDGFSAGVPGAAGAFSFTGAYTGNSFSDFLLGLPSRSVEGVNNRDYEPLDATSDVFALFVQDDWKVSNRLTVFLGARYEVTTPFRDRNDLLVNFDPVTGRLVLPDAGLRSRLTLDPDRYPTVLGDELGLGRALVKTDWNNFGPRLGFAYRVGRDGKTVLRGGVGRFFPTSAAQGIRDSLSRNPFRTSITRLEPTLTRGFSTGTPSTAPVTRANAVAFDLESPEAWQYHLTLERELPGRIGVRLSYLGTRHRKLLINRNINTLPASTVPFDPENPLDRQRLPYPDFHTELNAVEGTGRGRSDSLQVELSRRFRQGLAFTMAYTFTDSWTNAPDYGNSSLGIVQYDPYDLSKNEGPDPYLVRHRFLLDATWDLPIGRDRMFLSRLPDWADWLLGGWTVSTILQARSGLFLTPFYTGVHEDGVNPANTGFPLMNNDFEEAWRPDVVGDPGGAGEPDDFFNLGAFRLPAPGTTGNAGAGIIEGPGNWILNLGFYKEVFRGDRFSVQVRATLDNAFNHPQFFLDPAEDAFVDLTDYLVGGLPITESNGYTNVLSEVWSQEGFAAGRVVVVGLRVQF